MATQVSPGGKLALTGAVAVLLLTLIAHVVIREWYQADLRYELGGYYRSEGNAVTALKLQNHGRSAANIVRIAVGFPSSIRTITTSDPMSPLEILEGGEGRREVLGRIDRVVPGQTLFVFFSVLDPGGPLTGAYESYVSGINFAGGEARSGITPRHFLAGFGWGFLALLPMVSVAFLILIRQGIAPVGTGVVADLGPAKNALKDVMGSLQGVIELGNDVETLLRAGESLPKPFLERFSKYKIDAAEMKRRLLSHTDPAGDPRF